MQTLGCAIANERNFLCPAANKSSMQQSRQPAAIIAFISDWLPSNPKFEHFTDKNRRLLEPSFMNSKD